MPVRPPIHKPPGHRTKKQKQRLRWDEIKNRPTEKLRRSARFLKARKSFMIRNPICVQCLKVDEVTPSTVLDHIIAHKGDVALFWDHDNWQALCKTCHDKKTYKHDGSFGNKRKDLPKE